MKSCGWFDNGSLQSNTLSHTLANQGMKAGVKAASYFIVCASFWYDILVLTMEAPLPTRKNLPRTYEKPCWIGPRTST